MTEPVRAVALRLNRAPLRIIHSGCSRILSCGCNHGGACGNLDYLRTLTFRRIYRPSWNLYLLRAPSWTIQGIGPHAQIPNCVIHALRPPPGPPSTPPGRRPGRRLPALPGAPAAALRPCVHIQRRAADEPPCAAQGHAQGPDRPLQPQQRQRQWWQLPWPGVLVRLAVAAVVRQPAPLLASMAKMVRRECAGRHRSSRRATRPPHGAGEAPTSRRWILPLRGTKS